MDQDNRPVPPPIPISMSLPPPLPSQAAKPAKPNHLAQNAGIFAILGALAMKFKGVLIASLSFLKMGWFLKSGLTMFLSLGLYAMTFGWPWAIMVIVLLFIHEMGHFVWMAALGLKPQAPVFVPFMGAYVAMTNLPSKVSTHAWVAYAGPLVGGLGCIAMYLIGVRMNIPMLIAAAHTGFLLNLFQLLPIKPFDGGFIAEGISKWLFIPGILLLGYMAISMQSAFLIIMCVISVFVLVNSFRGGVGSGLEQPTIGERLFITLAYLFLAGTLTSGYFISQEAISGRLP
jgi:Zn-dependent protease